MAYCTSCGAYVPDGQSACLACGFDEQAEARKKKRSSSGSSAAKAQREQSEDMRELLEKHRAQQQEKNRQWAEQEQARRRQQEKNRQWAEQEYARRMEEKERQAESYVNRPDSSAYSGAVGGTGAGAGQGNKALACLSYLGILFALPYFFAPQDKFARYHARQGLKLFIFGLVSDVLGAMTGVGWILSLFRFYLIFKGINTASQGRMEPLPYIGEIGENR